MSTLYVVATPIGNLDDITLRALEVLKQVDIIGAETVSVARKLLSAYGISGKKLITVREEGRDKTYDYIKKLLNDGYDIAIISDAGTPGVSDPGSGIVDRLLEEGFEVVPIPGPSAITALLSVFPIRSPWVFLGFLPKKKGKRKKVLHSYFDVDTNMIFFESPYKIVETIGLIDEIMPDVKMCLGREMTKRFEEFIVGTPSEVLSVLSERKEVKGEIVCAIRVNK